MKYPNRRDWVTTILKDLEYLKLGDMSMEEIRKLKKCNFMTKVKKMTTEKLFEKLNGVKMSHSKVETVEHNELRMQKYL